MKCEFSETQFAFCFTFEVLKSYQDRLSFPWFPTLPQEGRKGGGWDVKIEDSEIGGSLFIQFKRLEFLIREGKYQIEINASSKQFKLLNKLKRPANLVYYAAPKFHTKEAINHHYMEENIEKESVLFAIEKFPNNLENIHKLRYDYSSQEVAEKLKTSSLTGEDQDRFGILNSDPIHIKVTPDVFSGSFTKSPMNLSEKVGFIFD